MHFCHFCADPFEHLLVAQDRIQTAHFAATQLAGLVQLQLLVRHGALDVVQIYFQELLAPRDYFLTQGLVHPLHVDKAVGHLGSLSPHERQFRV